MTTRLTAEQERHIETARAIVADGKVYDAADYLLVRANNCRAFNPSSYYVDYNEAGYRALLALPHLLTHLDALTAELGAAQSSLATIAGTTDCAETTPDAIALHVIGFAGAYRMEREHADAVTAGREEWRQRATMADAHYDVAMRELDDFGVPREYDSKPLVLGPRIRHALTTLTRERDEARKVLRRASAYVTHSGDCSLGVGTGDESDYCTCRVATVMADIRTITTPAPTALAAEAEGE